MTGEGNEVDEIAKPDAVQPRAAQPNAGTRPRDQTATQQFSAKANDLQALCDSVVDAASVGVGLWFSYLFVLFYFLVAVGGVTHRDLLLENPVKLPFLNVDLPLTGFFFLGPLLFIVVHAYVLLHFVVLAGKVGSFDAALRTQVVDEETRSRLRGQLPSNIFVQFLAGPREIRTGIMGFMLKLVAWISLVFGPLALLVFFQFQFLPYHSELITWWQRFAVVADLALLWLFWPSVVRGERARITWHDFQRPKVAAATLATLGPIILVFGVATFPGERLDAIPLSVRIVPTKWIVWDKNVSEVVKSLRWTSLHQLLVAGQVDLVARKPTSVWFNRLVLPGLDLSDGAKPDTEAKLVSTHHLRGRRLEGAVLIGAHLAKTDFTGAHLEGAQLIYADLREADFGCVEFDLDNTKCTQLRGASFLGAQLQGANFAYAQLQGANFVSAQLQGASLNKAQLQGTVFYLAKLQGANLNDAELQGAWLENANLQGASLKGTNLQGASLESADFQGAMLDDAQLQGASLKDANLKGPSLDNIFIWRADVENVKSRGARSDRAEPRPKFLGTCPEHLCDWSATSFDSLKQRIEQDTPAPGNARSDALQRIKTLNPSISMPKQEETAKSWADVLVQSTPSITVYEQSLAKDLRQVGCAADGTPYVIRRLIARLSSPDSPFGQGSTQRSWLATQFLDERHCLSARGLSEEDRAKLREMKD